MKKNIATCLQHHGIPVVVSEAVVKLPDEGSTRTQVTAIVCVHCGKELSRVQES